MRLIAIVLLSALCLSVAPAHAAADASVIVLGLRSVEGDDDFANALTDELRKSAHGISGWTVLERSVSMAQMSLAHGCDEIDASCLSEIAKGLQASRIVYGTVRRTSARSEYDYQLSVSIFDADKAAIGATETDIIPRADSSDLAVLTARATSLLRRLTAGTGGAVGTLTLQVNAPVVEVRLDAQLVGQTQDGVLRLEGVSPGEHALQLNAPGRGTYSQRITVSSTGQTNIIAALSPSGDEAGEGPAPPLAAQEFPEEPKKQGSLRWLGYTLVGVSGAALIGTIASWMVINGISNDKTFQKYSNVVDMTKTDICAEARAGNRYGTTAMPGVSIAELKDIKDMCSTADTFEVLQWVFLGTTLVSGGVGAYLLVTEKSESRSMALREPRLAFAPKLGRQTFGLSATLRF